MNLAVLYGSTYGDTAEAAACIATALRERLGAPVPLLDTAHTGLTELLKYDQLLVGCSTWYVGELQSDWAAKIADLERLDLHGRQVAFFGAGDQLGYPDTFQDALGMLAERFEACGAELKGMWPTDGYEFTDSQALRGDRLVGLALDYTTQEALSQERIERWVDQLLLEFTLPARHAGALAQAAA
ncbi:MAG TPA: flavodoxin [Trueperaceae bacterium]